VSLLTPVCILVYVLVITGVGVRMLLLARHSGRRPELLIGAGSVLICGIGLPTSLASGFGKAAGEVNVALWVGSDMTGILCMYAFTQQVFRPRRAGGRGWWSPPAGCWRHSRHGYALAAAARSSRP
jgi:hypothetical protein